MYPECTQNVPRESTIEPSSTAAASTRTTTTR